MYTLSRIAEKIDNHTQKDALSVNERVHVYMPRNAI